MMRHHCGGRGESTTSSEMRGRGGGASKSQDVVSGESADELGAFRNEVRTFIGDHLSEALRREVQEHRRPSRERLLQWHRRLLARGWATPGWPVEHGGCGWTLAERYAFDEEMALGGAPAPIGFSFSMVGPMIIQDGTDEQRARFLHPTRDGEIFWCQGFSEPGAGSDLASLQCRAEPAHDAYVINGTKIWTTGADTAHWMFGLFRTSHEARKQLGISMLLVPMDSPGITVRPIFTFDGGHEVNQTFFDDVRVPRSNLIGEEGAGWSVAKRLLGWERLGISGTVHTKKMLERLERIAATELDGGRPLIEDPAFSARLGQAQIDLRAVEVTESRFLFRRSDSASFGAAASILKIRGSEVQQLAYELAVEAIGYYASPDALPAEGSNLEPVGPAHARTASGDYFNRRKISIYGGTNEIQKNIVAKWVLEL